MAETLSKGVRSEIVETRFNFIHEHKHAEEGTTETRSSRGISRKYILQVEEQVTPCRWYRWTEGRISQTIYYKKQEGNIEY